MAQVYSKPPLFLVTMAITLVYTIVGTYLPSSKVLDGQSSIGRRETAGKSWQGSDKQGCWISIRIGFITSYHLPVLPCIQGTLSGLSRVPRPH